MNYKFETIMAWITYMKNGIWNVDKRNDYAENPEVVRSKFEELFENELYREFNDSRHIMPGLYNQVGTVAVFINPETCEFNVNDNCGQADNYHHAVHEAGHALVASSSKFFKIGRLTINNNGGYLSVVEYDREFCTHEKMLSDIQIACAGLIAEKVIFKTGCDGCDEDMQRVYKTAARAINRVGFASCSKTLPEVPPYRYIRNETEERRSRNEKEIEKLIRFCERKVTKFLRKNKKALIALADELFQKKNLKSSEVAHIIACNKRGGNYENC